MADMDVTAKFRADISDMKSKMDQISRSLNGMEKSTQKAQGGFTVLKGAVATAFGGAIIGGVIAGTKAIANFAGGAIDAASTMEELQSKVNAIFGPEAGAQIAAWSEGASKSFGQSQIAAQQAASTFAIFGKAAGLSGEGLVDFSTGLTELSSDLASFYDASPEEAAQAIGAALRGETEPIRRFGVLLDDATMRQKAFEMGLISSVKQGLQPNQKALVAQALIMQQTTDAQGDFARTSDGLANSQRTLAAVIEDVKTEVGAGLLPAVTELVQAVGPMLQELAGPLGEVANQVGTALAGAFEALAPILPVVAETLGQIAATIGGALADVLATLVPALAPVLEAFSELAAQLAPLLSKVLGKVAEILGRVLGAVTPLLGPLTDLVMGILDAAWPIIEVVADVLLMLVDALTPVLDAVVVLLQPLGELIEVLLAAILPVIKPILPVIEALAQVLAIVLTKAIGLLMTGIGGMIVGMSKIAPFILDNVTKPVVGFFLDMAKGVVGAAAQMLGWVPGLGDSLKAAEAAIGEFAVETEANIAKAADTIAAEGDRIGNEMINQGKEALTASGPALASAAKATGRSIGRDLGAGLGTGLSAAGTSVNNEARRIIANAEHAARSQAQTGSPSKVFAKIGEDLMLGLEKGLEDRGDKFAEKARNAIQKGIDAANEAIQEYEDYSTSVQEALIGTLNLGQAYEDYVARQEAASTTLAELTEYQKTIQGEATDDQIKKLAELQTAYSEAQAAAANGAQSIVDEFVQQGEKAKAFNDNLQTLLKAGLSKRAFDAIIAEGADRGANIAAALVQGNVAENARRVSEVYDSVSEMGRTTGEQAAGSYLSAGVNLAVQMLTGLIKEFLPSGKKRKDLLAAIKNLNDSIKFDPKYIDVITRYSSTGTAAGGGGGGGGGGGTTTPGAPAAVSPSDYAGAAASAAVASQFSQSVLSNAQRLNAAAAAGQDVTKLGFTKNDWADLARLEKANIAALATGGIAMGPMLALIGESGPEAVVPLSGRYAPKGETNIIINVNAGMGTNGAEVGREIVDALRQYERRNGPLPVKVAS